MNTEYSITIHVSVQSSDNGTTTWSVTLFFGSDVVMLYSYMYNDSMLIYNNLSSKNNIIEPECRTGYIEYRVGGETMINFTIGYKINTPLILVKKFQFSTCCVSNYCRI